MSRTHGFTMALAVMFLAVPLAAQGTGTNGRTQDLPALVVPDPAGPNATAVAGADATPAADVSLAPTMRNAAAGVHVSAATTPQPAPRRESVGRNPAMMIVGAVALIAGTFIEGDAGTIVMIAGGALGLYGLWQYLK